MKKILIVLVLAGIIFACQQPEKQEISLKGNWKVKLDSNNVGVEQNWYKKEFEKSIQLPGTLDDAGIGTPTDLDPELTKEVLLGLTRKHEYVGPAWYSREFTVPESWRDKQITLSLERVIWETQVWIDGQKAGVGESLSTPQKFNLTPYIEPGKTQRIALRIDNSRQFDISYKNLAHAYTNATQIIWNGVIGELALKADDPVYVDDLQVFPDTKERRVNLNFVVLNQTDAPFEGTLDIHITSRSNGKSVVEKTETLTINDQERQFSMNMDMGDQIRAWDEFDPHLYNVQIEIRGENIYSSDKSTFGMRSIKAEEGQLMVNGRPLFLRGTLECNIFPEKGYPPTSKDEWKELMTTARNWGLNHLRFHSWCPPEAAFEAADEEGFYLQIELPYWNLNFGEDEPTVRFLRDEAERIIEAYGNHPSFAFWSMGNEIQGNMDELNAFLKNLKKKDERHLYCATSFTFEKGHRGTPEPYDDFFITQYTDSGWVRGQGVFNDEPPSFNENYESSVAHIDIPLITHEIGQYSVFPDPAEAEKYTGNLLPLNFEAIGNDLEEKGLLNQAEDFHKATGKFAALLYKEEIERALKTPGIDGFQLLDLHDFPGQGTALVGLLDAFWDSKDVIDSDTFRQFSSPVVPLLNFSKAVYENDEVFKATPRIVNYSASDKEEGLVFRIFRKDGEVLHEEQMETRYFSIGNHQLEDTLHFDLQQIQTASELTVELKFGSNVNRWKIWVYPADPEKDMKKQVFVTESFEEAKKALEKGRNVLLNPDRDDIKGIKGMFVPVFWSPVHFPNQPGTMGLLVDTVHKALDDFPTSFHSDWQWWDLSRQSKTLRLPYDFDGELIVQVVDNFAKNRYLATVFEAQVGKGKLLFSSMDISNNLEERPAARQLRRSFLKYMNSDEYMPKGRLDAEKIERFKK